MEDSQEKSLTIESIVFSGEDFNDDDKVTLTLLSEMVFTPPYELYVINICNKIIQEKHKKIKPIFEEGNYTLDEVIKEYKDIIFRISN
jgi:hypothetical protein